MDKPQAPRKADDSRFELAWAPEMYPGRNDRDQGRWRLVLEDDEPVGIVWTNDREGAGVTWLTATDAVTKINKHLHQGAMVGTPAADAYLVCDILPGVKLSPEFSGSLSGVTDELNAMKDELTASHTSE